MFKILAVIKLNTILSEVYLKIFNIYLLTKDCVFLFVFNLIILVYIFAVLCYILVV